MGHRTVKRVAPDFGWPLNKTWEGFLLPEFLREQNCDRCDGRGYSPRARTLHDLWYGHVPFDPAETGSPRLTSKTPAVRFCAANNVERAPEFYGRGEAALEHEAQRLADLWNGSWSHHLEQADVDALIAGNRLYDLTHTWTKGDGWKPRDPMPAITAAQVNAWAIKGFGHDSSNCWVAVEAKCEREGVPSQCSVCCGHGQVERWPGQRTAAEVWQPMEPPTGEGWQLWETTSEGSPVGPVCESAEALADWAAEYATAFADMKLGRDAWLQSFLAETTDVDTLMIVSVPHETGE